MKENLFSHSIYPNVFTILRHYLFNHYTTLHYTKTSANVQLGLGLRPSEDLDNVLLSSNL